jgi:hypothetical protein
MLPILIIGRFGKQVVTLDLCVASTIQLSGAGRQSATGSSTFGA